MKTPIEVKDIRAGDLIRWEAAHESAPMVATEYRASEGGEGFKIKGRHYLLDRPAPPVELPTEPTLGWVIANQYPEGVLGSWATDPSRPNWIEVCLRRDEATGGLITAQRFNSEYVTAFTPAVAVPASALDELRAWDDDTRHDLGTYDVLVKRRERIQRFLAAVGAANGDAS